MRAIFIDSNDKQVYEARIKGNDFREIRSLIGCDIITGGYSFDNGDYMYVDDEGLFQTNRNGFIINNEGDWGADEVQLIGNALIIGSSKDDDGSDADAVSSIEDIRKIIQFKTFI